MAVAIARSLLADLLARAAATPAMEVCGLLFGSDTQIEGAVAAANVADEPSRRFEIDPAALFAALRAERAGGPRLIGHYHSHPNGATSPSPCDVAAAEPGRLWLILAGGEAGLWRATAAGFNAVEMVIR